MNQLKVLIVDDSAVARRLLSDTISADPTLKVVGTAVDGQSALRQLEQLKPDIITLDVEMPGLSGIDTVKEIRKLSARIPIIMFSSLTELGSVATLEALTAGASDYVTKPTGAANLAESKERITRDLVSKIKVLCKLPGSSSTTKTIPLLKSQLNRGATGRIKEQEFQIIAIGCSTGGPTALAEIIPMLPGNFPIPVVITQHMPPVFTKSLANRLAQLSKLSVCEAADGMQIKPGNVYIAPGDLHLEVRKSDRGVILYTHKGPLENSCRPAVDVMFRSLPEIYGGRILGVILTGMGQDGLLGARRIVDAGGTIVAQDEPTSVVWGMPGAVVNDGLTDCILPLKSIAADVVSRINSPIGANKGTR